AGATQSFGPGGDGYIVKTDSIGNSGCFESNVIFTVTSPPTVVANITTLVSSGGVANIPVATIGSVGIANTLCFTVGIPVLSNTESISIFPNPSSSIFNVESSQKISQIEIYDVLGKIIYQSQPSSPKFEIDLSDKPKGIYFVKIISDYKNYIQKVIIQ
ncbi:MAG TPA: T9SS type A sorting domain-containing protein, partial [Chitinophagaceae bacterium]|nr:T9SS type A sorting domain-containing protein [Chitinophagaceae bacterium]